VVYQVYPRSFFDGCSPACTGTGSVRGIEQKLGYLRDDLGVDILWISPIYDSPMADFGYDISNYTSVWPTFGAVADVRRLVATAKSLGLRVLMDLVPNHSCESSERCGLLLLLLLLLVVVLKDHLTILSLSLSLSPPTTSTTATTKPPVQQQPISTPGSSTAGQAKAPRSATGTFGSLPRLAEGRRTIGAVCSALTGPARHGSMTRRRESTTTTSF
jgi:hypothetical protein